MATPDPFADLQPRQPVAQDPFADLPAAAQAVATDPFADLPSAMDTKPMLERVYDTAMKFIVPGPSPSFQQQKEFFQGAAKIATGVLKLPGVIAELTPGVGPVASTLEASSDLIRDVETKFLTSAPKEHWWENTPEALGSAAAFLATGGIGGIPALAGTAVATTATAQYDEAVAAGADPDQAAVALFAGGALGLTEVLPGKFFLDRINKLTGGKLAQVIREQGFKGLTKPVWEAVKGTLVEATQEGVQQVGSNWIARDIAQYDPSRTLGENFWDNALTGGAVGSILGGGIGLIRRAEERQALKELEERFGRESVDVINHIEGAFTPVEPLMKLYDVRQKMDAAIAARAQQATAEKEELVAPGATPAESLEAVRRQVLEPALVGETGSQGPVEAFRPTGENSVWHEFAPQRVEAEIETALPKKADGSVLTVEEALAVSPVVVMESQLYKGELTEAEKQVRYTEKIVEEMKSRGTLATVWPNAQKALQSLQDTATALRTKRVIARNVLKEVKGYVAALRKTLGQQTKVVIADVSTLSSLRAKVFGHDRWAGYVSGIANAPGGGRADIMYIRIEDLVEEIHKAQATSTSHMVNQIKREVFETISHEMGHALFSTTFEDLLVKARTGTPQEAQKAYETYNFIEQEYRAWLRNLAESNSLFTMAQTKFPPQKGLMHTFGGVDQPLSAMSNQNLDYAGSIDEFFADMTARLATQGQLPNSTLTDYFKPLQQQYKDMFEEFPQFAKNEYGNNWLTWLKSMTLDQKLKEAQEAAAAGGGKGILDALSGKIPGFDPKKFAGLREYLDNWSKGISFGFNLLQMVKENPHIPHWQTYLNGVEAWANYQRNLWGQSIKALEAWRGLGKAEASQLSNALLEEQELRRRLTPGELSAKLTAESIEVYTQVRKEFDFILDEMHAFALQDANTVYEQGSEIQKLEVERINDEFRKMKARGYFPSVRFGKYTIEARATEALEYQGENYAPGQLITFPVFESQSVRDEAVADLRREFKGKATVSASIMREDEFAIQGMPRSMLRALKSKLNLAGDLTPAMAQAIDKELENIAPFRNFSKQFQKKRGIHGASNDMMRSFAYYTRSAAGHISRVKFSDEMLDSIKAMQKDVQIIQRYGGYAQNRQQMVHWMKRHFSYIMNPANELAGLRGAGFVAYLGFMIKSAAVNAMQVPMVAYPYLAARYNDPKAIAALIKGGVVLKDWVSNKKDYINALDDVKNELAARLRFAIRQGAIESIGAHFSTTGGSTYFDPSGAVEYFDLSKLNILDSNNVEVLNTLAQKAGVALDLPEGGLDYISWEENPQLQEAAKALGYDGIALVENDDLPGDASTINVFNNLKQVKQLNKRSWEANRSAYDDRRNSVKARTARLYAAGNNEGWLDQSLATELAIAASENNLDRGLHLPTGKRIWHEFSRYSAMPFHLVEKMNRYVVATAAYNLEYDKTSDHNKSVLAAKQAVWTTQYENARWNRPEVLRGKKSVALLFMNYVQNTLFFAVKDPGARRWWMMMLLMAGVMGLPGMEDLEDLIDFTSTALSRKLGLKNPKFQLRVELREALEELHANPDLVLHGLSQSSFGLGHIGELTGIPIPRVDLSGSLGMGNIIPGTGIPGALLQSDPNTAALRGAAEIAGATGNLIEQFYAGIFSNDPDTWKRMEKVVPFMFLRAGSKALRYAVRGEETTAGGEVVAKFDPHDTRDQMELVGQAFGFTPSRIAIGWERVIAVKDAIQYYQVQQTALQRQINWAYFQEDREAIADVKAAIKEYNASVPFPELSMTPQKIRTGVKEYVESHIISGMGETGERKNRRLRQSIEEAYPDPYGDTVRRDPFADL